MDGIFQRTQQLLGREAMQKLKNSKVAVFGLGGVGGYTVETLARSGVGSLTLVDGDKVVLSNLNRQIFATLDTVGMPKTQAAAERIAKINPDCALDLHQIFYCAENADEIDFSSFDCVVDAVDTVAAKILIIKRAKNSGVPVISCMGAGNKLDITALKVADIYKTQVCPLARVMRRELKKEGVDSLKVVYSEEAPATLKEEGELKASGRPAPASCALVPPAAGLIIAGEVIKELIK
ncbi:MAG: tRNA threonylcarbamoyladenosine dehydratase [Muribaculaceae bacterium]|nr:tRNA threonylcarbamoyladenosine dehydratase [Muribaculaceae bacterium]